MKRVGKVLGLIFICGMVVLLGSTTANSEGLARKNHLALMDYTTVQQELDAGRFRADSTAPDSSSAPTTGADSEELRRLKNHRNAWIALTAAGLGITAGGLFIKVEEKGGCESHSYPSGDSTIFTEECKDNTERRNAQIQLKGSVIGTGVVVFVSGSIFWYITAKNIRAVERENSSAKIKVSPVFGEDVVGGIVRMDF